MTLEDDLSNICTDVIDIVIKKNADYGDNNLLRDGLLGVAIRLGDKVERIKNLCLNEAEVDESIDDTLRDIIGYALNSIRLRNEKRLKLHTLNVK